MTYSYLLLIVAMLLEVLGTILLPISKNFTKIIPSTIILISYSSSIFILSVISQKLPLSLIYASWAGMGIFLVSIFSIYFYKQSINWQTILGLFFIILGVSIVNYYKISLDT